MKMVKKTKISIIALLSLFLVVAGVFALSFDSNDNECDSLIFNNNYEKCNNFAKSENKLINSVEFDYLGNPIYMTTK